MASSKCRCCSVGQESKDVHRSCLQDLPLHHGATNIFSTSLRHTIPFVHRNCASRIRVRWVLYAIVVDAQGLSTVPKFLSLPRATAAPFQCLPCGGEFAPLKQLQCLLRSLAQIVARVSAASARCCRIAKLSNCSAYLVHNKPLSTCEFGATLDQFCDTTSRKSGQHYSRCDQKQLPCTCPPGSFLEQTTPRPEFCLTHNETESKLRNPLSMASESKLCGRRHHNFRQWIFLFIFSVFNIRLPTIVKNLGLKRPTGNSLAHQHAGLEFVRSGGQFFFGIGNLPQSQAMELVVSLPRPETQTAPHLRRVFHVDGKLNALPCRKWNN